MVVSKGYRLKNIKKEMIFNVSLSNNKNLIFQHSKDNSWYYVFSDSGFKIPNSKVNKEKNLIFKEFLGNDEILNFLIDNLDESNK